uniref:Uncharacterized protein n=1 Tax=Globisporangium ultimum (strain ATCC 200006 / CBS 805.95 / DAOM BR144) TaxID=431595 RepID=K3W563_GLOUD
MLVHDVGAACARESSKTGRDHVSRSDICAVGECIDIYTNHALLHLVLSDEAFASIRFAKVSLEEALHHYGKGVSVSKTVRSAIGDNGREENESTCALLEILKHVDDLPMIDRARSYVLASKLENECVMVQAVEKFPIDASMYPCEAYHELLVAACTAGHTAMVAQLLEHGAHPLEIDENGESLTSAVRYNHLEVVHQLEAAGQIPANGAIIVNGLRLACARGSISMVDTLLAHYASASNAWDHHPTLLRSAVQSDNLQVVELLLECDPRGAFIRMDQLIDQLQREMTAGGSTPRLDAIIGKYGYFAWDLHAFETAVRKNDTVLFDLLVNHIEWDRDDLKA